MKERKERKRGTMVPCPFPFRFVQGKMWKLDESDQNKRLSVRMKVDVDRIVREQYCLVHIKKKRKRVRFDTRSTGKSTSIVQSNGVLDVELDIMESGRSTDPSSSNNNPNTSEKVLLLLLLGIGALAIFSS
jgi:hypothetical protein